MMSRERSPDIMVHSESNSPTSSSSDSEGNVRDSVAALKAHNINSAAPTSANCENMAPIDLTALERPRSGINLSRNGSHVISQSNSINASQPRAGSTNSNGAAKQVPVVPHLFLSGSQARLSAASTTGGTPASQARASGAAARASTSSAATSAPVAVGAGRPPSAPVARPTAPVAHTPSASMPRPTAMAASTRRTGGSAGSKAFMPQVVTATPDYTAYPPDISKYLKDAIHRREEAVMLRLLPTAQLMDQAVLQAQTAYELIVQQEAFEFLQISHKRKEAEMKRKEVECAKANKERMEEQKRQHREEMAQQKNDVTMAAKQMEADIREKLKALVSLQPKLNIVSAVMAQLQDPASDCRLLGALLMEERQLQKALKGDARYNKLKTAGMDGGAEPYWWKHCVCASFNVSAMMRQEPHRASIVDVPFATKTAADKKVVVVKDGGGNVVAWAHTRSGPDPNALAEAYAAAKLEAPELPANAYKGVLWPKEDAADVTRKARAAKSPTADILPEVITTLSYREINSHEMSKKDIAAMGEGAS
ncbi:hypothetical protein LSCM4_05682 [Leishmania orientalis]|uniref:Uncharacterized protein n=1 Tax=Leishmania orientalis TaxID=2249476 RepID=A0A836KYB6_9TRYP|nr:hypothetical protein LSCM4_05682 [Leishmania orientalis]